MTSSFRAVVKRAFVSTVKRAETPDDYPALLAEELRRELRANGLAIHSDDGGCVRIPPRGREQALGRPLTDDEHRAHHPNADVAGCRACEAAILPAEVHGDDAIG